MTGRVVYLRSRRVAPRLVVSVTLEGTPTASIVAATLEDEQRLALWLERSDALELLQDAAAIAVAEALDDGEARGAA